MKHNNFPLGKVKYGKRALELPEICAFDFETDGLGGEFIVGAFVSNKETVLFYSINDCFDYILRNPRFRYLAHNASGYEFGYLLPSIYDYFISHSNVSIHPTLQGESRIVQIIIKKNEKKWIDLRDTLCLFGTSLENVAKSFCPELPKLKGPDFEHGEKFDKNNIDHIRYNIRDCEVVLAAYRKLAQQQEEVFGSPLGVTAGSSALMAFRASIPDNYVYYRSSKKVEDFVRGGYYGGLVLPGHRTGNWGNTTGVDINGAYAYQMGANRYPVGTPCYTSRYIENTIGFYRVIATVPSSVFENCGFNPLPRRTKHGVDYPTGTFETTISTPEYNWAIECGCTLEVIEGYTWYRTEPVFSNFVNKCEQMETVEGGKYKPTVKQNRNSLYGKFGTKETHKKLIFSHELLHNPIMPFSFMQGNKFITIEDLWVGNEESDADYTFPMWAALTTAYERVYLMRYIKEAYQMGANNVYADTDSLKSDTGIIMRMIADGTIPIGNKYGQFKVEETCKEFIVLGPKCYGGVVEGSEKQVKKAKGIPKKLLSIDVYREAQSGIRNDLNFVSIKSAMNIIKERSTIAPIKRHRKITDIANSRAWTFRNGRIYPNGYLDNI